MKQFDRNGTFAPKVPFKEAKRHTPAGGQNLLLIVQAAVFSGVIILAGSLLICWGAQLPARYALISTGGSTILLLLAGLSIAVRDDWMWQVEEVTGFDLNTDGAIGQPVKHETHYDLKLAAGHYIRGVLPVADDVLIEWSRAAITGGSLSYATWTEKFALQDGTQGREHYGLFRQELVKQGLANEVGGNVGLKLTKKGRAVIGGFAEATPNDATPLLDAVGLISPPTDTAHTH